MLDTSPIHCLKQLLVHIVVKFMLSVVWDKHHLLHPLGSLNALRIIVGDGVSRYTSHMYMYRGQGSVLQWMGTCSIRTHVG